MWSAWCPASPHTHRPGFLKKREGSTPNSKEQAVLSATPGTEEVVVVVGWGEQGGPWTRWTTSLALVSCGVNSRVGSALEQTQGSEPLFGLATTPTGGTWRRGQLFAFQNLSYPKGRSTMFMFVKVLKAKLFSSQTASLHFTQQHGSTPVLPLLPAVILIMS